MSRIIAVEANWDPEAKVWVAESADIPLVAEAPTVEALVAKLPGLLQDLLEDQNEGGDTDVPFELCARFSESVRVRGRAWGGRIYGRA